MLTLKPNAEQLALIELARREGEITASRLALAHLDLRNRRAFKKRNKFVYNFESEVVKEFNFALIEIRLFSPKRPKVNPDLIVRNIRYQRPKAERIHLTAPIAVLASR